MHLSHFSSHPDANDNQPSLFFKNPQGQCTVDTQVDALLLVAAKIDIYKMKLFAMLKE